MIGSINEDNFKEIDPQVLSDPKSYQDVEDLVIGIDSYGSADYAKEYAIALEEKLQIIGDQMEPGLFNKYLILLKALRLFSLLVVKDNEKEKFFSEQVMNLFSADFVDVEFWTNRLMENYSEAPDIINELRKIIIRGLENNFQKIGNNNLITPGIDQSLAPTVKNWLRDYNGFARLDPKKSTKGALDQVNYINQSSNAKKLDLVNRNILFKLIKFYDWIRFAPLEYDFSLPDQPKEADVELSGDQHILIPKELADAINNVNKKSLETRKIPAPASKLTPARQIAQPAAAPRPPIRSAAPKQPMVSSPPQAAKSVSNFDQNLSKLSTAPAHGQSIEALIHRVEESEVKPPVRPQAPVVKMTPAEIKREIATPELPTHEILKISTPAEAPKPTSMPVMASKPIPQVPSSVQTPKPMPSAPVRAPQPIRSTLASIASVSMVDDLKKIELGHLRQGPIQNQMAQIKNKIISLAQANHLLSYYTVNAFEQSPLFRTYLAHGNAIVGGEQATSDLTQAEFEALADLRKELDRL